MRVTTVFNRVLALPGAVVDSVSFDEDGAVVAGIHRTGRRHRCPCGWSTWARYDVRRRRWRHLDMAGRECWLEADIARIGCRRCGRVKTEDVPWARPGARCTRAVEDTIGWLAQRMDKTAIADLLGVAWRTVDAAVARLVGEHLDGDAGADGRPARLDGLRRIGVDEISYKRGHQYLTVIADHDTGRVVWAAKGRTQRTFEEFVQALGPIRAGLIEVITMDMSGIYRGAAQKLLPGARICFDPFHVIKWANEALDHVLDSVRAGLSAAMTTTLAPAPGPPAPALQGRALLNARNKINQHHAGRAAWRKARFLIRSGAERLPPDQRQLLDLLRAQDLQLARAWELKEGLRDLYQRFSPAEPGKPGGPGSPSAELRLSPANSRPAWIRRYLHAWCDSAIASGIPAFKTLAARIIRAFDGITAAVELGLSNSRLEGINAKIRVIQRRGYGYQPASLITMIHLCLGGIPTSLPTKT